MRQANQRLTVETPGRGLQPVTPSVAAWVADEGFRQGLLTLFIQHTSASLTIQENADPDVLHDLDAFLVRLAPDDPGLYRHTTEGPDDMPAHIRAALTATQLAVLVAEGRLALGTWQGIYVFEHRIQPHTRHVMLHFLGE